MLPSSISSRCLERLSKRIKSEFTPHSRNLSLKTVRFEANEPWTHWNLDVESCKEDKRETDLNSESRKAYVKGRNVFGSYHRTLAQLGSGQGFFYYF